MTKYAIPLKNKRGDNYYELTPEERKSRGFFSWEAALPERLQPAGQPVERGNAALQKNLNLDSYKKELTTVNILTKMSCLLSVLLTAPLLTSCVTEGAAFGLGAGSLHETVMTEKDRNAPPPVYGPPQIIYRIDDNRYFTLENYTRCENGQTFYNNKLKNIHVQISPSSGYLFKGRFFWTSTRDDYLAFPVTRNDNKAACMGSDKGCMNIVALTTDGGKTKRSVTYGGYTQDPNGNTKNYDMLVTNEGFYMIKYAFPERSPTSAYALKWTFYPDEEATNNSFYSGATGPVHQPTLSIDVSQTIQETMQCDRRLEPVQNKRGVDE
ncbi:hypothetical protein J3D56_003150 [Erwinia persicina]|uniref:T6SS immunity protein Tli3 family protein n=1 Tax=Erwinia persicina TaxID=55211 RepID=UPI0020A0EBF4|nr:hypothetical protein [Erwinia persicina]MCP1439714.1 hypothetical protein [Erwinia persicina]